MASSQNFTFIFILLLLPSLSMPSCNTFSLSSNRLFDFCRDLPTLSSSLHWTYNTANSTLSIAFTASPASPNGWISWGINPTSTGMRGTQALLAFHRPDGSLTVETFNIAAYYPVLPLPIMFETWGLEAEYVAGEMQMFATVKLLQGMTELNQVWQVGASVTNGVPDKHEFGPQNLNSMAKLDVVTALVSANADSTLSEKNIHGVLNAVSWGILLPIGAMIARFLKAFRPKDTSWFHLHVSCQLIGYAVGVTGWATGLSLGSKSERVEYTTHRNLGIALFSLATLQVFALFVRPRKEHKIRSCWNVYHHGVGYAVIIMGIINVFEGISILQPDKKWVHVYIIVICGLGLIALFLEITSWIVAGRRI
ncbi:Cytochrome b561 and DOMON domain-containing protein [Dioscorea alata]|uniref:Cytochrome b561 and DOMON domain-containing protein n=1 Tax=Dioscorea alata TaxID=55571 RepID=A0ACB7W618_DIOAL|nr:Cytochrome b561 and DOMON domain-containing protein [Dioscorea alata]